MKRIIIIEEIMLLAPVFSHWHVIVVTVGLLTQQRMPEKLSVITSTEQQTMFLLKVINTLIILFLGNIWLKNVSLFLIKLFSNVQKYYNKQSFIFNK